MLSVRRGTSHDTRSTDIVASMTEPTDTHTVPALPHVNLTCDLLGNGALTIDGHDLSKIVACGGVTIQVGDGRGIATKVYVELLGGATYDGPAAVTIIQGAHAVEFLQSVNPDHLTKATLEAGINRKPIEVALEVLIGMAQAIETGESPE